jgi:hypothetical protein
MKKVSETNMYTKKLKTYILQSFCCFIVSLIASLFLLSLQDTITNVELLINCTSAIVLMSLFLGVSGIFG